MNFSLEENKAVSSAKPSKLVSIRNAVIGFFDRLVNGSLPKNYEYEIAFGAQAAGLGEHGRIVGTWVKEGHPREISISFYIKGFENNPPRLNRQLMKELYEQAAFNGILMTHISGYAAMSVIRSTPGPTAVRK